MHDHTCQPGTTGTGHGDLDRWIEIHKPPQGSRSPVRDDSVVTGCQAGGHEGLVSGDRSTRRPVDAGMHLVEPTLPDPPVDGAPAHPQPQQRFSSKQAMIASCHFVELLCVLSHAGNPTIAG